MPPTAQLPRPVCQRCGRSCTGHRVVPVSDAEARRIRAHARQLGVASPLSDGALRTNMGRCCLWSVHEGCRLHARFGPESKPTVCRQFPWVRAGEQVGLDPACPTAALVAATHDPARRGELLGASRPRELPTSPELAALVHYLGWGVDDVRGRWARVPWAPLAEASGLGPHLRQAIRRLSRLAAPDVLVPWPAGARAVATCWELQLGGSLDDLVLGASVIAAAPEGERRSLLAAWVKLVR